MISRRRDQHPDLLEGVDANVLRATRLMRLFNEQLEATRVLLARDEGPMRESPAESVGDRRAAGTSTALRPGAGANAATSPA